MNLQQITEVMSTEFWKEFIRRATERRQAVAHSYMSDKILDEKQWLKHAKYQGEWEGINKVLSLPEEIIQDEKGRLGI